MPPKQAAEESQADSGSGAGTPTSATSQASSYTREEVEKLWYQKGNARHREIITEIIYYDELKTIRRKEPILNPEDAAAPVVTVEIWERPEAVMDPRIGIIGDDDDNQEGV